MNKELIKLSLKAIRINLNLKAKDVALAVGIHYQTLLKYENDSSKIPYALLKKLSDYYEVPMDYIFLGKKYDLNRTMKYSSLKKETKDNG